MAMPEDLMNTIALISDFWPHLPFTKEDFVQGKIDFIIQFYTYFVNEVNDQILYLINEEINIDEFDGIMDFDKKIVLFYRVRKIYKKVNLDRDLNLGDFYVANPKKMYPLVKFSIHFVIYVNNYLDDISTKINELFKKVNDSENFKTLKQQFLQDTAENAENLARMEDIYEGLKTKLEGVKQLDLKKIEDKIQEDKICSEKELENNHLQNELDNLEYELNLLEDKENDLKESVITEKEYENLKNTEAYLKVEEQDCKNFEMIDCIDKDSEYVKILEEHTRTLSSQSFDSLDVAVLQDLKHQTNSSVNVIKKLKDEKVNLNNVVSENEKQKKDFKRTFDKTKTFFDEIKNKITAEEQNEDRCYQSKFAKCTANFEELQRLESEIITVKENIRKIETDTHALNAFTAQEYQRVLQKGGKLAEKLHNVLLNIVEQCSHGEAK